MRHLPSPRRVGLLLFERSGADLGIRMSWKPNVTVHLPCISILTPRTSHQTSPSKSPARADSHAAAARTSVELWQLGVCAFRLCVCVFAAVCETSRPSPTATLARAVFGRRGVSGGPGRPPGGNHFLWHPAKKKKTTTPRKLAVDAHTRMYSLINSPSSSWH